jgi:hypothetical protein
VSECPQPASKASAMAATGRDFLRIDGFPVSPSLGILTGFTGLADNFILLILRY